MTIEKKLEMMESKLKQAILIIVELEPFSPYIQRAEANKFLKEVTEFNE